MLTIQENASISGNSAPAFEHPDTTEELLQIGLSYVREALHRRAKHLKSIAPPTSIATDVKFSITVDHEGNQKKAHFLASIYDQAGAQNCGADVSYDVAERRACDDARDEFSRMATRLLEETEEPERFENSY